MSFTYSTIPLNRQIPNVQAFYNNIDRAAEALIAFCFPESFSFNNMSLNKTVKTLQDLTIYHFMTNAWNLMNDTRAEANGIFKEHVHQGFAHLGVLIPDYENGIKMSDPSFCLKNPKITINNAKVIIDYLGQQLLNLVKNDDVVGVSTYLEADIPVNFTESTTRKTALIYAAQRGSLEMVQILMQYQPDVNHFDCYGLTALMVAAQKNFIEIVKLLLPYANKEHLNSALLEASANNCINIVRLLIQKGANPNACNKNGTTALMKASGNGYLGILEFLIHQKAEVNCFDNAHNSAMHYAAMSGSLPCIKSLFKNNAIIDVVNWYQMTPLQIAAEKGFHLAVSLLLKHHADINHQSADKRTALIYAARGGFFEIVQMLLANNANANIYDNYGKNAYMYALEMTEPDKVKAAFNSRNVEENKVSMPQHFKPSINIKRPASACSQRIDAKSIKR
jgi:ankyrin repeat protein